MGGLQPPSPPPARTPMVDEVKQKLANKSRIFYSHVLMNTSGKVVMAAIVTVSNKQKLALSKIKLWRKDLMEEKKN